MPFNVLVKTASAPNLFRSIGTNSAANNQNEFSFGNIRIIYM